MAPSQLNILGFINPGLTLAQQRGVQQVGPKTLAIDLSYRK